MKKKLFLSVLAVVVAVSSLLLMSLTAVSAEGEKVEEIVLEQTIEKTYDEFEYIELSDGTLAITKYIGTDNKTAIPYKIDGKIVSAIGDSAFANNENLTYVFMYGSVTNIADNAFEGCENVEFDTYPDAYACQYAVAHGIICSILEDEDPTKNGTNDNVNLGDVNGDGRITTADVGFANSFAKGVKEPSNTELLTADMNKDGKISTIDVGMINLKAKSSLEIVNYEYIATVLEEKDGKALMVSAYLYSNYEVTEACLKYADNAQIDPNIAVGDKVKITSSGIIIDTAPPIISEVISVVKMAG